MSGRLGPEADALLDRVSTELDTARASARGVRGEARRRLIARLHVLDDEVLRIARDSLDAPTRAALEREAADELTGYRARLAPDAFARAMQAVFERLVRERLGLPTIAFR